MFSTNEAHLRQQLHQSVDNLSLVNIIILLMLIQVVRVISLLRPAETKLLAGKDNDPADPYRALDQILEETNTPAEIRPEWRVIDLTEAQLPFPDAVRPVPGGAMVNVKQLEANRLALAEMRRHQFEALEDLYHAQRADGIVGLCTPSRLTWTGSGFLGNGITLDPADADGTRVIRNPFGGQVGTIRLVRSEDGHNSYVVSGRAELSRA